MRLDRELLPGCRKAREALLFEGAAPLANKLNDFNFGAWADPLGLPQGRDGRNPYRPSSINSHKGAAMQLTLFDDLLIHFHTYKHIHRIHLYASSSLRKDLRPRLEQFFTSASITPDLKKSNTPMKTYAFGDSTITYRWDTWIDTSYKQYS